MENKFTKEDIRVGYLVEIESGEYRELFVVTMWEEKIIFTNGDVWHRWSSFDENLCSKHAKITKVFGWTTYAEQMWYNSADGRPLIWERKEPVKITKKEIEKILGYEIEIV